MPETCDSCGIVLLKDEWDLCDGCRWTIEEIREEGSDGN